MSRKLLWGAVQKESAAVKAARQQMEAKRKLEAEREEFERAERERIAKEEAEEEAKRRRGMVHLIRSGLCTRPVRPSRFFQSFRPVRPDRLGPDVTW